MSAEIIIVEASTVACDGGELGHPRVFLQVEENGTICPYCSREFKLKAGVKASHH